MEIRCVFNGISYRQSRDISKPFDPIWDIIAMFIGEEFFGTSMSRYKKRMEDPESGGYGNNQVGITKTDDGMFEMSDQLLDDDEPSILLNKKQLMGILDLIEETGAKLRTLRDQKKLPKEVIYTFDDDWNGSVEFKY